MKNQKAPPFIKLAKDFVEYWHTVASKRTDPDKRVMSGDMMALGFFYLGEFSEAREVSLEYSEYRERKAITPRVSTKASYFFFAGLYRSLSMRQEEANALWERLVDLHNEVPDEKFLNIKFANTFVHLAYALAKLGRYTEVFEPATKGFEAIENNHGVADFPHLNTLEYLLVDVLKALASYQLEPSEEAKQEAQSMLVRYKEHNFKVSRQGYAVIFDLQFSYPDIFDSVLPGPDPELD